MYRHPKPIDFPTCDSSSSHALINMSFRKDIIDRGGKINDVGCRYKWNWEWVDRDFIDPLDKTRKWRYGDWIRKIDEPGTAYCALCRSKLVYSSKGFDALTKHAGTMIHRQRIEDRSSNSSLSGNPPRSLGAETYGIHPLFKNLEKNGEETPMDPLVPTADRQENLKAVTLAFIAENSLPLTMSSKLIEYGKMFAKDPKATDGLHMDRTTASYKLKFGVAKTMRDPVLEELRSCPFSLNIDEATSKINSKVLAVLSCHFSPSQQKIVVHHLDAFEMVQVNAASLFEKVEELMTKHRLEWNNLVSVLLDSCRVMRGEKSGLETRIRQVAPHLLDIDGDTCHHASNAARKFCTNFAYHLEGLLNDIHTEFKWSVDQREMFFKVCLGLGIKPTRPERYVPHRWLSVLDVAADTSRLFDALSVFVSSFIMVKDVAIYDAVVEEVYTRRGVSEETRRSIKRVLAALRKKWTSYTNEGKERKLRLVEKLFVKRDFTLYHLNLYLGVLPILKKYVMFFQKREPVLHRLHDKQDSLLREFIGCFVQPEVMAETKNIVTLAVKDTNNHLPNGLLFLGDNEKCLKRLSADQRQSLLETTVQAFVSCAQHLQKQMPVNNPVLQICCCLDPAVRNTTRGLQQLLQIPDSTNLVGVSEVENFKREVRLYNSDRTLNQQPTDVPIDQWWAQVSSENYPNLTKAAKGLLSCFHGPLVESSFSIMGDILDEHKGGMDIDTYAAIQFVKSSLCAQNKTAAECFGKRDPIKDHMDPPLMRNMHNSASMNEARKEVRKQGQEKLRSDFGVENLPKPTAKAAEKQHSLSKASLDKEKHSYVVAKQLLSKPKASLDKKKQLLPKPKASLDKERQLLPKASLDKERQLLPKPMASLDKERQLLPKPKASLDKKRQLLPKASLDKERQLLPKPKASLDKERQLLPKASLDIAGKKRPRQEVANKDQPPPKQTKMFSFFK